MAFKHPNARLRAASRHPAGTIQSGVVHVNVRHTDQYVVIGNHLAQHRLLSATAIGIGVHIQSLPTGARVGIKALADRFPEGEVRIAAALRELEACGYLERVRVRTPDGRLVTRTVSYNRPRGTTPEPPNSPPPPPDRAPVPAPEPAPAAPEPVPAPVAAQEPAPEQASVPVAVSEPAPAASPVPAPVAAPQPVPAPEPAPVAPPQPSPVPVPEAAPQPMPMPAPEPVAAPERASVPVAAPEPTPEPESAPEAMAAPERASVPVAAAAPGPAPAPAAEPVPQAPAPVAPPVPVAPSEASARQDAVDLLARLRADDPRLLLAERDVRQLAPGVSAWLDRGADPESVRHVLTGNLPADMRSPAAVIGYRLRVGIPPHMPKAPAGPTQARRPDPLQNCDGCERAFRAPAPGTRCRDCPPEGQEPPAVA